MTADEYRAILREIGLKQSGERSMAALLGLSGNAIRQRLSGRNTISAAEQIVLRLMREGRLTYDEAMALVD